MQFCQDDKSISTGTFAFIPIADIATRAEGDNCDVIGVVRRVDAMKTIVSKKSNQELTKRELTLLDSSGMQVDITLWGKQAETYNEELDGHIVAIKQCRITEFNGAGTCAAER